jgi:hypothetical protein
MNQVITIKQGGGMETMRSRKGIDPRRFGKVAIRRVSEIEWDEKEQGFFIRLLRQDAIVTRTLCAYYDFFIFGHCAGFFFNMGDDPIMYFHEYEEAVKFEIAFLNHLRKMGVKTI